MLFKLQIIAINSLQLSRIPCIVFTCDDGCKEGQEDVGGELDDDVLIVDLHGAVEAGEQREHGGGGHLHQGADTADLQVHCRTLACIRFNYKRLKSSNQNNTSAFSLVDIQKKN